MGMAYACKTTALLALVFSNSPPVKTHNQAINAELLCQWLVKLHLFV